MNFRTTRPPRTKHPAMRKLAVGMGTGSELRRPLGITIVGGVAVSQILTPYTTPVVYIYMAKLQN